MTTAETDRMAITGPYIQKNLMRAFMDGREAKWAGRKAADAMTNLTDPDERKVFREGYDSGASIYPDSHFQ